MKRLAACLLILALSACGGGGAVWTPSPAPVAWQTVVAQPATIPVYNDRGAPRGTVGVTCWGVHVDCAGSVRSAGGVLDITIDSARIDTASNLGKGTIVLGTNLAEPIRMPARLRYSFDLRVSQASVTGSAVAHVVAYFSFRNRVTGQSRWNGRIVYDTRCGRSGSVEKWDTGSDRPIFNVVDPAYSCQPHDWRSFTFTPSIPLSADDELRGIVWNPETHTKAGERAELEVGVRNWRLERAP